MHVQNLVKIDALLRETYAISKLYVFDLEKVTQSNVSGYNIETTYVCGGEHMLRAPTLSSMPPPPLQKI
jgi:hypothetical protein